MEGGAGEMKIEVSGPQTTQTIPVTVVPANVGGTFEYGRPAALSEAELREAKPGAAFWLPRRYGVPPMVGPDASPGGSHCQ
jgi:hypothetical protein